ncbi:prenyltransferase/squalene oxidase repeat-containing protein [Candidatus Uabimicrobium sp. HlEnr_7]|uniref:prenyltransferase/squalene oxidase repeat-containing protein n=1 Tax=Candidatus Uabimicrobium helgolandensis TaxID=3095367 RepID=UPI003555DE1F
MHKILLFVIVITIISAKEPSLDEVRILICEEGAIPNNSIAKNNDNVSLSQLLLSLDPFTESKKNPKVLQDFEYLTSGYPQPLKLLTAITPNNGKSYISLLRPEYIKHISYFNHGRKITGAATFFVKGLYRGHVDFAMKKIDNRWEIYQFSLHNYGWIIIQAENGNWRLYKQKNTIGIKDSFIVNAEYKVVENASINNYEEDFTEVEEETFEMSEEDSMNLPFRGNFTNDAIGLGGGAHSRSLFLFDRNVTGESESTKNAVRAGLLWLKRHQQQNGRWDGEQFTYLCGRELKYSGMCDEAYSSQLTPSLTALSLLCFVTEERTQKTGEFRKQIKSGLRYLISIQDSEGCFGSRNENYYMYNHALAALAMVEAYNQFHYNPLLRNSAQQAVDFLVKAQNFGGGWGDKEGESNIFITGWCIMTLKCAQQARLNVSQKALVAATSWVNSITKNIEMKASNRTAIAAIVFYQTFLEIENSKKCVSFLLNQPEAKNSKSKVDFEYFYYKTLAMAQFKGNHWASWNEIMKTMLVDSQCTSNCKNGSWDSENFHKIRSGRIYTTAMNILTLQIYYRYNRMHE